MLGDCLKHVLQLGALRGTSAFTGIHELGHHLNADGLRLAEARFALCRDREAFSFPAAFGLGFGAHA